MCVERYRFNRTQDPKLRQSTAKKTLVLKRPSCKALDYKDGRGTLQSLFPAAVAH